VPRSAPGDLKVLLVGDSTALRLSEQRTSSDVEVRLMVDAQLGCSIAIGSPGLRGEGGQCAEQHARWVDHVARFDPDVVAAMFGPWELLDREINGEMIRVGTAAYEALMYQTFERVADAVTTGGARFMLFTSPCFDVIRAGRFTITEDIEEEARVESYNAVVRRFVADNPDRAVMADLHALLCPSGQFEAEIEGVRYTTDGIHVNREGAELVWRWLDPQLERFRGSSAQ
jgi:hypothetical protein